MSKQILITIICAVLGAIILLGLGYSAGYLAALTLEKGKTGSQIEQLEKAADTLKILGSSKIISSFTAIGEVTKINERDITLESSGDILTIHIRDDAKIYSAMSDKRQQTDFKDIKKGDTLNISLKLLSNGQIEGQEITIIPVFIAK